jgi:Flp pilus assembly secretin CpaC
MAALFMAGRGSKGTLHSALHWLAAAALLAAFAVHAVRPAAAQPPMNDAIVAPLDVATLFKLPERTATLVIGNPLIADVSIQAGGAIGVVTGKGYGVTNVVVLDHNGVVLMEKPLVVTSQPGKVVFVYRGPSRTTYACEPDCSARVNLGDDPDVFDKILAETVSRTTQALTAGSNNAATR